MSTPSTGNDSSRGSQRHVPSDNTAGLTRFQRLTRLRDYWDAEYDRYNTEYEAMDLPPDHPVKWELGEKCQNAIRWWVILTHWTSSEAPEGVELDGVMYI